MWVSCSHGFRIRDFVPTGSFFFLVGSNFYLVGQILFSRGSDTFSRRSIFFSWVRTFSRGWNMFHFFLVGVKLSLSFFAKGQIFPLNNPGYFNKSRLYQEVMKDTNLRFFPQTPLKTWQNHHAFMGNKKETLTWNELIWLCSHPAGIYLFKVNNRNTRTWYLYC